MDVASGNTYVNRVVFLLHPVGGQDVLDAGKLVKQPVLETKHGSRPDNGRLGEDAPDYLLTTRLGSEELGLRLGIGIVRRDVDEAVDIVFGDSLGDALSTLDMDILEGEVPGPRVNTCPQPPLLFRQCQTHLVG